MFQRIGALRLLIMCCVVVGRSQAAEQTRKDKPKDTQTTKRVWTNDDFSSTGTGASIPDKIPDSASSTLEKFRHLGKEDLGAAVLKMANAPDVDFADRRNWEQRLFEAKQAWLDQLERMEGHKNSSKDVRDTEIRLTQGAHSNFERIAGEGIQQARAVNDPKLKAHLQYEKQADFCRGATGAFLQQCIATLDRIKSQAQQEGNW